MFGTASYLPRPDDFTPTTRRGHGTTHPNARTRDGIVTRQSSPCVHDTCERTRASGKGDAHLDKAANAKDWATEHRLAPAKRTRR